MINLRSIATVFRFEIRQAATIPRMAWWFALTMFPIMLSGLLQFAESQQGAHRQRPRSIVRWTFEETRVLPAVEIDGKTLTHSATVGYMAELAPGALQRKINDQMMLPLKLDDPDSGPEFRSRPSRTLVVRYPATMEENSERLDVARGLSTGAFSRVVFVQEGEPEPNLIPPSSELISWGAGLFVLLPSVVTMLATFLWSAPAIASELEGRSWAYIATRPHGPVSVLLGKYAIGVVWGLSATMTALVVSLLIADIPEGFFYLFWPLALTIVLSTPAYGAIYALIGTIAPRRAMVVSVAYTIVLEGFISFLPAFGTPALVSRLSVQYPIRSIIVRALRLEELDDIGELSRFIVPDPNLAIEVVSVLAITIAALVAAVWVLQNQELTAADESDS